MSNLTWKGTTFKIDNASSTPVLTDLSAYTNKVDIKGDLEALEDTALNDEERSYVAGLAGANLSANLFGNSTVNGIFAPLLGNRTSITKTVRYYDGNKWYAGETLITEVSQSGAAGALQTWAITGLFDGAVGNTTT